MDTLTRTFTLDIKWIVMNFPATLQVEDLARLSFQTTPIYIDVDDGRTKVEIDLQFNFCMLPITCVIFIIILNCITFVFEFTISCSVTFHILAIVGYQ